MGNECDCEMKVENEGWKIELIDICKISLLENQQIVFGLFSEASNFYFNKKKMNIYWDMKKYVWMFKNYLVL